MFLLSLNNFHLCDMSLEDDAFHSDVRLHIETWYFEAIFEDNESIVFMITSISNGSKGILMVGMHFYGDGKILYEGRKIFHSFFLSSKIPLIIADGKEMMRGYLNEKRKLCYNISFFDNGHGFQLLFENTTKGWRTNEKKLWVAIPNMKVEGKIVMGKEKSVNKKMKAVVEKTDEELATGIKELNKETFNLKIQSRTGNLEKPARLKEIRREIARIKTEQTARIAN